MEVRICFLVSAPFSLVPGSGPGRSQAPPTPTPSPSEDAPCAITWLLKGQSHRLSRLQGDCILLQSWRPEVCGQGVPGALPASGGSLAEVPSQSLPLLPHAFCVRVYVSSPLRRDWVRAQPSQHHLLLTNDVAKTLLPNNRFRGSG